MRPTHGRDLGAVVAAGGLMALLVAGVCGYLAFGYDLGSSVGMTLLTLTTVGFSTGRLMGTGPLIFTALLAVAGVGLFAATVGVAVSAIVEGRISLFSRSRRMQKTIEQLKDHFIVCAYGRVGRSVARELAADGLPYVVIDSKPELEADMDHDGVLHIIGSASDEAVLRQAGVERARGLICAVDSDAENVYITVVARSLRPELLIVARAAHDHTADRLYRAGANKVVSPYVTSGRRMANLAVRPNVVDFFDIARSGQPDLRLEELVVVEGSPLVGRTLAELPGVTTPLLLRRADGQLVVSPPSHSRLGVGDTLVVYGEPGATSPGAGPAPR